MNDTELQAILERCEAATAGPWSVSDLEEDVRCGAMTEADWELCATARTDLPAVVHELQQARELLREWCAADEDTDELTRIPAIMAVERRTRYFLEVPDAE